MKYTTPIIWFAQCTIWLFNAINAGIKHNWMAMAAFIWIIVLCVVIGFESILRYKMSEELRKLSEKNNESYTIIKTATVSLLNAKIYCRLGIPILATNRTYRLYFRLCPTAA